jgi:hypothetical protein
VCVVQDILYTFGKKWKNHLSYLTTNRQKLWLCVWDSVVTYKTCAQKERTLSKIFAVNINILARDRVVMDGAWIGN